MNAADLHVISVISNPVRYETRARLMREFLQRQAASGVTQWVVEAVFGDRAPEIADPANPRHIVVRCDHEIWIKEAMLDVARRRLPLDAKYVMWCDADIEFVRDDWAVETLEALRHYAVVQPWSHAVDLGPDMETMDGGVRAGFAYGHQKGHSPDTKYGHPYMHPGYCWAWRLDAWDAVGGMIKVAIAGAGDDHMAKALVGRPDLSLPTGLHPNYYAAIHAWAARAKAAVNGNIGHVPGTILHYFHGWKVDRSYWGRWNILRDHKYDPVADLEWDWQGMPRLTAAKPGLRDALHKHLRERNEDAGRKSWPC